jgi:hypothetical protein
MADRNNWDSGLPLPDRIQGAADCEGIYLKRNQVEAAKVP